VHRLVFNPNMLEFEILWLPIIQVPNPETGPPTLEAVHLHSFHVSKLPGGSCYVYHTRYPLNPLEHEIWIVLVPYEEFHCDSDRDA
jgi:hypothetical protein